MKLFDNMIKIYYFTSLTKKNSLNIHVKRSKSTGHIRLFNIPGLLDKTTLFPVSLTECPLVRF